jgi:hypothetical protein
VPAANLDPFPPILSPAGWTGSQAIHLRALVRALERPDRQDAVPGVDHGLAGKIEVPDRPNVARTGSRDRRAITSSNSSSLGPRHERIGGHYRLGGSQHRLLELIAEGRAGIVDIGPEGHAEQPDRHAGEIIVPMEIIADRCGISGNYHLIYILAQDDRSGSWRTSCRTRPFTMRTKSASSSKAIFGLMVRFVVIAEQ